MTDKPYVPSLDDIYAKNTIYISSQQQIKYGYQIKVGHPEVLPFYLKFKEEMHIPCWCPLSDAERLGFERLVLCGYYPIRLRR